MSSFAWVDFAEEDRRKMAEVIDLFREQDTRDELGLGVIRDALADILFPGTSTIQTRARYFLFIPWIYRRYESKGIPAAEIARNARRDEDRLIEALVSGGETNGVIGIEKRTGLQRPASNIYWAGLGTWRIRRFQGSQEQYHRAWDSLLRGYRSVSFDDDKEPVDSPVSGSWDPGLPEEPSDFLKTASMKLTVKEADYLQHRVLALKQSSLLGHLLSQRKLGGDAGFVWTLPQSRDFPAPFQSQVEHARCFSEAMWGAALLYNLMLSEERNNEEWAEGYRKQFEEWASGLKMRSQAFQIWQRREFWGLIEKAGAHVGIKSRQFVDGWLEMALGGSNPLNLTHSQIARNLIRDRERVLKRTRARLENPRALERWNGNAGANQLSYRWNKVRTLITDIRQGLEA